MKVLFLLLCALPAMALPSLEEARASLGSQNSEKRASTTLEIWKNGKAAQPLLRELLKDSDPEVANRVRFILRRLRMGLTPDSPPKLLHLAEALEQANPDKRIEYLVELLEHGDVATVGLAVLDQWAIREGKEPQRLLTAAELVTEALLEQRSDWKKIFTTDLSPLCRALILGEISKQDVPMKAQMIAILATPETELVYANLKKLTQKIDTQTLQSLARVAIVAKEIPLALRILKENLPTAPDPDLARTLAFLEAATHSDPSPYAGPWQTELKIFRARLLGDRDQALALNQQLKKQQFLKYENQLISGQLTLPSKSKEADPFPNDEALKALHSAFDSPPTEPDIEALSASILIDWTVLARTLTLLGSPIEAAETLSTNEQNASAVGLLWRTNHRKEALALAQESFSKFDERKEAQMRITLTSLHLEAGEKEAARKVFDPLIYMGIRRESYRKKAISLGLQLYPREKLLPLVPGISSGQAYQRAPAISYFLTYPDKVAATWFEHFREEDHLQSPTSLFKKVESFLEGDLTKAREIISKKLAESSKELLLPSDDLYQNIHFLQLPEALEIVTKAAWYQLSTRDLLAIISDDSWPEETRKEALQTALLIDPISPSLRWYHLNEDLDHLHQLTLGDAKLTLELASLTKKRETLKLAAEIADLRDFNALRCLNILAKSYLENKEAAKAARLYQVTLCGEIAVGTQPATPIPNTLENLTNYFEARSMLSEELEEKEAWKKKARSIR